MYKKIFFIFIISVLILYIINFTIKIDFFDTYDYNTSKDPPVFLKSDVISHIGLPTIHRNINLLRPVNVPLTPLIAPLKILDPITTKMPSFLLYKTDYLTKIQDQGICGSCWVFSVTAMLGDRVSINTEGLDRRELSSSNYCLVLNLRRGVWVILLRICYFWLEDSQYKIKQADNFSYRQERSDDITTTCPISNSGLTVVKGSVNSLTEFIEEDNPNPELLKENIIRMKTELIENGPFFCTLTVYEDFYEYDGLSVYSHSSDSPKIGGHAIEIIGYCDKGVDNRTNINGEAYWICRNSWGSDWPVQAQESGYFAVRMGVNESGIESRCGSAKPFVPDENKSDIDIMRYNTFNSFMRYNRVGMFS